MGIRALHSGARAARRGGARALARALALALPLVAGGVASADPSPEERALADARFREGRELLDKERVDEACAKFEESNRLSPRGGTALNLAACREKQGKPATAWAAYTYALELARKEGRTDREEIARNKIASLERELSWLVIQVPAELDVPGLVVTRDGVPVGRGAWGIPVPADPGRHTVGAVAPGVPPFETTVEVGPRGDRRSVTVPRPNVAPRVQPAPPSVRIRIDANGQASYQVFTPRPPPRLGELGVVRLHVESPAKALGVFVESTPEQPFARRICNAPCDAIIDGRDGEQFFFDGQGTRRSSTFGVAQRKGDVTGRVVPGSPTLAGLGYASITTGAVAVPVGAIMLLIGPTKETVALCPPQCHFKPRPPDSTVPIVGGVALAAGAGVLVGGIALVLLSRTKFTLEAKPAAAKAVPFAGPTPSGLAATF